MCFCQQTFNFLLLECATFNQQLEPKGALICFLNNNSQLRYKLSS